MIIASVPVLQVRLTECVRAGVNSDNSDAGAHAAACAAACMSASSAAGAAHASTRTRVQVSASAPRATRAAAVGDRARGCIDRDVTVTITCASLSQAKWSPCWCRAINSELHELPRDRGAHVPEQFEWPERRVAASGAAAHARMSSTNK